MKTAQEIADEQMRYLRQRGFGPVGLANAEGPQLFMQQLQDQVEEILNSEDAHIVSVPITAVNIGLFNKGKDSVQFHFNYEFDPIDQLLHLKVVDAVYKDVNLPLLIEGTDDLSTPAEIFRQLNTFYDVVTGATQNIYFGQVRDNIDRQQSILSEKGYSELHLRNGNSVGKIARRLEAMTLSAATRVQTSGELARFRIDTTGKFNNDTDPVSFVLHYEFVPQLPLLRPRQVTANLNGNVTVYTCNSIMPLPTADDMYRYAKHPALLKRATELANHKPDYGLKKAKGFIF